MVATAQAYQFHAQSPLPIGVDLNPISMADTKQACMQYGGIKPNVVEGAVSTTSAVSLVKSHQELLETAQLDKEIATNYKFTSAAYNESSVSAYAFRTHSLIWLVRASRDCGLYEAIDPRWKSAQLALADASLLRQCESERYWLLV